MTRKFVILLIVTALLFLGFYFFLAFYNSFVGGIIAAENHLPALASIAGHAFFITER